MIDIIPSLAEFIYLIIWMILSIQIGVIVQTAFTRLEAYWIYPFVCRKCTTFWVNWLPSVLLAYIWDWKLAIYGLITAICLVICIKKSKDL